MRSALGFAVLLYVALGIAGITWMSLRGDDLGARTIGGGGWTPVGAGLGFALAVLLVSDLLLERFEWTRLLRREVLAAFAPLTPATAVTLAVLSGVGEELFFRGALQPAIGWVASAVVFGALHTSFDRQLAGWTLFATVVGFGLGGLFHVTGSVLAPAIAHTVINGVQLTRLATTRRERVD